MSARISAPTDHKPLAVLADYSGFFLVDREGVPFKRVGVGERGRLPMIVGIDPQQLSRGRSDAQAAMRRCLAALVAYRQAPRPRLSEIQVNGDETVTLHTANTRAALRLDSGDLAPQLARHDALQASAQGLAIGCRVRLAPHARARGPVRDAAFGELLPSFAGVIVAFSDGRALVEHPPETCGCFLTRRRRPCFRCSGHGAATRRFVPIADLALESRPSIQAIILSRSIPQVPWGVLRRCYRNLVGQWERCELPALRYHPRRAVLRAHWPTAIGRWLGAADQLTAVMDDGRQRLLEHAPVDDENFRRLRPGRLGLEIDELLEHAEECGYWLRPVPLQRVLTHPIPEDNRA